MASKLLNLKWSPMTLNLAAMKMFDRNVFMSLECSVKTYDYKKSWCNDCLILENLYDNYSKHSSTDYGPKGNEAKTSPQKIKEPRGARETVH